MKSKSSNKGLAAAQRRTSLIYMAPACILITVFILLPFILSVYYSFTNKMLVPKAGKSTEFVGFANYIKVFTNSATAKSFVNTGIYALMVVPAIIILGTLLAVFVNKPLKGVKTFRAIYFSPQIVTMTVVAVVWSFILSPNDTGIMNSLLSKFGIPAQSWLQDSRLALFSIAIMYIWQTLGMEMLIILGGLQYIPLEVYEAADLDGCSGVQRFVRITVPLLNNTMVYVMLSVTINTLKLFTQVYMLTNGGPKNATTSVIYQLYKVGFMNNQQGFSSAIAVVFFVIVLGISLLQNYLMRDK